jgi:hypothetical protein
VPPLREEEQGFVVPHSDNCSGHYTAANLAHEKQVYVTLLKCGKIRQYCIFLEYNELVVLKNTL